MLRSDRTIRVRLRTTDLHVILQVYDEGEVVPPVEVSPLTVLDAGANVGITTGFFLDTFPEARVLALEPDPENIEALRRNVDDERVVLVSGGLWDKQANLTIANPESASWARQVREVDEEHQGAIRAFTIQGLAAQIGVSHFDVLKIDIEGAEARVLDERFRTDFEAARMVFIEAHGPEIQAQANEFLQSCGFTLARQGDMTVAYRPRAGGIGSGPFSS
jgi:FkbM family methyltransferase